MNLFNTKQYATSYYITHCNNCERNFSEYVHNAYAFSPIDLQISKLQRCTSYQMSANCIPHISLTHTHTLPVWLTTALDPHRTTAWTEHLDFESTSLVDWLRSGPHLMGLIGSGVQVRASFQKNAHLVDWLACKVIKTWTFLRCEWISIGSMWSFRGPGA